MGSNDEAMRDALELIRSLKEQYPDETEDQLISRFHKELEGDQALRRALMRDVFKHLLQELGEGKPPNSKE
jgi:2-polyprenyl-6-methoxyphenol hydroxylase-like FAD-dependent oxidoreductase